VTDHKNEKTIEELKVEVERRSHPAARVFTLLIDTDADAWEKFCADVATNGLQAPILIDRPVTEAGWLIIDGRNRELACLMRGIEPKYEVVNVGDSAAVVRVISANLLRRHDDVSVRAAQLAKLLEMLRVENFPRPTVPVAAAAAGMSDRTLRDALRLRNEDPALADQVAEGNISGYAARHVAGVPPGEERDRLKQKIAAAGNKKKAKVIVRETKRKKREQREIGALKMPGLTGAYSTLLAVLENVPRLPNELRKLRDDPNPLSVKHACELRTGIERIKTLDAEDLFTAAEVAVKALDRLIARADDRAREEQPAETGDTSDAVPNGEHEASAEGTVRASP
jgi:hypothetical protein